MKKLLISMLILLTLLTACRSDIAPGSDGEDSSGKETFQSRREKYSEGLKKELQSDLEDMDDLTEYVIDLTISEDLFSIQGYQKTSYTNLEEGDLESLDLTLGELLVPWDEHLDEEKARITIRQLLTMTSGISRPEGTAEEYFTWLAAEDQVAWVLEHPLRSPPRGAVPPGQRRRPPPLGGPDPGHGEEPG